MKQGRKDALLLRGTRDFDDPDSYCRFADEIAGAPPPAVTHGISLGHPACGSQGWSLL